MTTETEETEIETTAHPLDSVIGVCATDIGRKREENQDSFGTIENSRFKLFSVCDGMGGARGGAVASQLAISVIKQHMQAQEVLTGEALSEAIQLANQTIYEKGCSDPTLVGMGTTCVLLAFDGDQLFVANVGDSRAYRLRGNELLQLTEDHTLVRELLRSGAITEEQAGDHPVSHMLTRSLGPAEMTQVDCWATPDGPAKRDKYLLCSDGLYNMVAPEEFGKILAEFSAEEAKAKLIDLANSRGGTDNITVVIIEVGEAYPVDPAKFEEMRRAETAALNKPKIEEEKGQGTDGATAAQNASHMPPPPRAALPTPGVFVLIFLLGVLSTWVFRGQREIVGALPSGPEVSVTVPLEPTALPQQVAQASDSRSPVVAASVVESIPTAVPEDPKINMIRRLDSLQEESTHIQRELGVLNDTTGTALAAAQEEVRAEIARGERKLDEMRNQLDVAARTLAVWYGRKNRSAVSDPINLSTEVAAFAASVMKKKQNFEQATWNYLKEAEVLRYDPSDHVQGRKVQELLTERNVAMKGLIDETKQAIELEVGKADKNIAELTVARDQIETELVALRAEGERYAAISSLDPAAKAARISELSAAFDSIQSEIAALRSATEGNQNTPEIAIEPAAAQAQSNG